MQSEDEGTKLESAIEEVSAMENQPVGNKVPNNDNDSSNSLRSNNGILIGLVCLAVLAVCGFGINIVVMMEGNARLATIDNDINELKQQVTDLKEEDEYEENDFVYGKPASANEIDSIYISYNGQRDFIDIFDNGIDYYSYGDNQKELIRASVKGLDTDTSEIRQYVFDNDLDYLTETSSPEDDYDWSIEVDSLEKGCMISGTGEYPEWFGELLNRLNVSEYGNYSIKNT